MAGHDRAVRQVGSLPRRLACPGIRMRPPLALILTADGPTVFVAGVRHAQPEIQLTSFPRDFDQFCERGVRHYVSPHLLLLRSSPSEVRRSHLWVTPALARRR